MNDNLNMNGKIEKLLLADLIIDPSYQRGLKPSRKKIRKNFNSGAVGVLHVGRRSDGKNLLIDGQQRRSAMMDLGITEWECYVIESSGSSHEAAIFSLLNGGRTGLHARELFKSALEAKDPSALALIRSCEAAGLNLQYAHGGSTWPNLTGVAGLYRVISSRGEEFMTRALGVLAKTWPEQDDAVSHVLVMGWLNLYASQGDKINDARMIERLRKCLPQTIINNSLRREGDRHSNVAYILAEQYNKRLSPANKLTLVKYSQEEEAA